MTQARLAQAATEVLRDGDPQARLAQAAVEVLRDGTPQARLAQVAVEVLRPNVAPPPAYAAPLTFKQAARQAGRQPVTLLAVETAGAARFEIGTQADWQAAALTRISTTETPGSAVNLTTETGTAGQWPGSVAISYSAAYDHFPKRVRGTLYYRQSYKDNWATMLAIRCQLTYDGTTITSKAPVLPYGQTMPRYEEDYTYSLVCEWEFDETLDVPSGETVTVTLDSYDYRLGPDHQPWPDWYLWLGPAPSFDLVPATASLVTAALDVEAVPIDPYIFGPDDVIGAGGSITYSAEGRNLTTDAWTSLGAVADGDELDPYRYYRFTAAYTANGPRTSELRSIGLREGDFLYFSTCTDEPVPALSHLAGVSSLSSKITLDKGMPSTGEVSPKLTWTRATGDMLATGILKGRDVRMLIGFKGLALSEYQPYHVGTFYDWSASPTKREITLKVRDALKRFEKVKIPKEGAVAGGRNVTTMVFAGENIIEAMLRIFDAVGIPDRYIDREAFIYLRDGVYLGADWQVTRTLTDPEDAKGLIDELCQIAGVWLVALPDGRLTPVRYDPTATQAATLDAAVVDFGDLDGNLDDLYSRQAAYYDAAVADPSGEEDYDKAYLIIDAAAEIAWGESSQKTYLDKWGISAAAAQAIAERWKGWYVDPLVTVPVKNLSLAYIDLLPGQIVAVKGLMLPVPAAYWGTVTTDETFLVTKRSLDPRRGVIDLELRQVVAFDPAPETTVLLSDTFTDSDSTALTAHTPETGGPWSAVAGTAEVVSNEAAAATYDTNLCLQVAPGQADVYLEGTAEGQSIGLYLVVRAVDVDNFVAVGVDSSGDLELIVFDGGVETRTALVATGAEVDPTLKVMAYGSTIKAQWGGNVGIITEATHATTGTQQGFVYFQDRFFGDPIYWRAITVVASTGNEL